jgi:hypothetical protein
VFSQVYWSTTVLFRYLGLGLAVELDSLTDEHVLLLDCYMIEPFDGQKLGVK